MRIFQPNENPTSHDEPISTYFGTSSEVAEVGQISSEIFHVDWLRGSVWRVLEFRMFP
jgi:hypothetical protein